MEQTEIKKTKKPSKGLLMAVVAIVVIAVLAVALSFSVGSREKRIEKKLAQADRYMTELKYEEAIVLYNEVLEIEPKTVRAYEGLITAYMALGEGEKAQETVVRAEEYLPAETVAKLQEQLEAIKDGTADISAPAEVELKPAVAVRTEKSEYEDGKYFINEYDADDYLIIQTLYNADDTVDSGDTRQYDVNGKKRIQSWFDADGKVYRIAEYDENEVMRKDSWYENEVLYHESEYDENEVRRKESWYENEILYNENEFDENGVKRLDIRYLTEGESYRYEYDDNERLLKQTYYKRGGILNYIDEYEYEDAGKTWTNTTYDEFGSVEYSKVYEYDSNGNCVKMTGYRGGTTLEGWHLYTNDAEGNTREDAAYDENGTLVSIYEYDAVGNRIKGTIYAPDGTIQEVITE